MNYRAKRVFIFDWDGTLFDSMSAKTESFSTVISNHLPCGKDEAAAHYRRLSGHPRREIFAAVAKACGTTLAPETIEAMSGELTALNLEALKQAPLFDDALSLLHALQQMNKSIFISSSVPQDELQTLVAAKLPVIPKAVFGSSPGFSKGKEHIARIRAQSNADALECIVIGDDRADAELSQAAGVDAVIVDREGRFESASFARISSLQEVTSCLI